MIETKNLTKTFPVPGSKDPFVAVNKLSFQVQQGEVVGLLGANGAGKTTTMRVLCTLLAPTSGSASIAGFDVISQPDQVRSSLGFVSASTGIYDRFTPLELLDYHGQLHGMEKAAIQERAGEIFATLGLEQYRNRLGAKLSTGTRQKLSLARALLHNPPVLVLDEPTAGLDLISSLSFLETILALKGEGKTVLYSSHQCEEVEKICDRVLILEDGQKIWFGNWREGNPGLGLGDFFQKLMGERKTQEVRSLGC